MRSLHFVSAVFLAATLAQTSPTPTPITTTTSSCASSSSPSNSPPNTVSHWLYTSELTDQALTLLNRPDIDGVQTLYRWRVLEPEKGQYDFSQIRRDLDLARSKGKKFWVQVQDRTFNPNNDPVPQYLKTPAMNNGSVPQCDGGCDAKFEVMGWVAAHWNAGVRIRFQALLKALADEFDGEIEGINLAETSIEVEFDAATEANNQTGFSCQSYFNAEIENALYAASIFKKTHAVQYVNFWPCEWADDHGFMSTAFKSFAQGGVGAGGPDNIPFKKPQLQNSYPFLSKFRNELPISVIAVQEPDLKEINPKTNKPFTKDEFVDYAVKELGSDVIFWALSSPWLSE